MFYLGISFFKLLLGFDPKSKASLVQYILDSDIVIIDSDFGSDNKHSHDFNREKGLL